jgi:hypothetical protein
MGINSYNLNKFIMNNRDSVEEIYQLSPSIPLCRYAAVVPPMALLDAVPRDPVQHHPRLSLSGGRFLRSSQHSDPLNAWCQSHINPQLEWDLQIITSDLPIHRDAGTKLKLMMIIEPGGIDVETRFYNPALQPEDYEGKNPQDLYLDQIVFRSSLQSNRWYLMQVGAPHSVVGMLPGQTRISLVANIN